MPTTIPSAPTMTPNDAFRHVRKIYVTCVGIAIPLLFLAFYLWVERATHGIVPTILLVISVGLLIFSMMVRAAAACPRCSVSLLWKKGPIGTGHLSLGEKSHCPGCGLDLNAPWIPQSGEPGSGHAEPNVKEPTAT
ncbi:MAG: hypothetical protein AB7E81_14885 [Hyphomicrobiaceae bacterium]